MDRYASMSVQFSRGCPFDCEFCNVTAMFGHRPRTKTPDQVIAELDGLCRAGWRGAVFFVDDNFIGNKRALKEELLPTLIQWQKGRRGTAFYTEASINLADDAELMRLMVEAGFNKVFVGIETPEEAGLAECNKRQNQKRNLIADVKRIQRAGLEVQGGFIIGFDSDTPTIFARQIEFIQQSGIVTAMVGLLQALREYQPPKLSCSLSWSNFMAFLRANLRLGIFGRERFQYWGLLLWTSFHRPTLFPLAVTLAIYGHHFRRTCRVLGL